MSRASVSVNGKLINQIGPGIVILLGLQNKDNLKTVKKWAEKAVKLKMWP